MPPQTTMCQTGVGATALNIKFIVLFSHSEPNHLSQWGTAEGRIFTVPACLPTAVPLLILSPSIRGPLKHS